MESKLDILMDSENIKSLFSKIRWDPELKALLFQKTNFLPNSANIGERLYCIHNNITSIQRCSNQSCSNEVSFQRYSSGYNRFCSKECRNSSADVKSKRKLTNINRYGGSSPMSSKRVREKIEETCLKKYGVSNPSKANEVKDRKETTILKNYGVKNPSQAIEIKKKKEETSKLNHGYTHWTKNPKSMFVFKGNLQHKHFIRILENLSNVVTPQFSYNDYLGVHHSNKYKWKCVTCSYIFLDHLDDGNIPRCPICNKTSLSNGHQEVCDYIKSISNETVILNDRKSIAPFELDIYIPNLKIGIEYNGIYWHSELRGKTKNYHLDKTNKCKEQNIQLIHIFETEWLTQNNIVKSRLRHILGLNQTKIHARKCIVRHVSNKEKKDFLQKNHIQGNINSSVNLGLYFNDVLVSVMTFGKARFSKKYEWELLRFASLVDTSVMGGAGKLLSWFEVHYKPSSIISYADKRWSSGNVYKKLGFVHSHDSHPNYFYFRSKSNATLLESRNKFQKHKLKKLLSKFDGNLSEWENMKNNGYNRIWDCGNMVFVKESIS